MAAVILCNGTKGLRRSLPRSRTMIHQPSSGVQGQITDIEVTANEGKIIKRDLIKTIVNNTGQSLNKVETDMERDYWMSATEAKKYGIIDGVVKPV